MRKRTAFTLCDNHAYLSEDGRRRMAEIFCEGGPAYGKPCAATPCRVRPGSDIFGSSATDAVADEWVRDWAVNRARAAK